MFLRGGDTSMHAEAPRFEMIRLYQLTIYSIFIFIFVWNITHTKYPNSKHISSSVGIKDGLRFNYDPSIISMFKTSNKFKTLNE